MQALSSHARILIRTGSIVLLWVLSVSMAQAAPGPASRSDTCEAQATVSKKLPRYPKSYGGPVAKRQRGLIRLADLTHRLQRGTRTTLDDDDAAIQNDGSAASIDADKRPMPNLQPLGVLVRPLDLQALSRAFSPRSPRGPPFKA